MAVTNGRERNIFSRYCSLEHCRKDIIALCQWVHIYRNRYIFSVKGLTASWWISAKNACKYRIFVEVVRSLYAWRRPYTLVHCMYQLSVSKLLLSAVLSLVCKTINNCPCRMLTHFSRGSQQSWAHQSTPQSVCDVRHISQSYSQISSPNYYSYPESVCAFEMRDRPTATWLLLSAVLCLFVCLELEVNINKLPYGRSIYRVFDRPYGGLISWVCISLWP
jgi:hypothetical protein